LYKNLKDIKLKKSRQHVSDRMRSIIRECRVVLEGDCSVGRNAGRNLTYDAVNAEIRGYTLYPGWP